MIWIVLGVALWWAAHLVKRLTPGMRGTLQERMGDGSKGLIAVALLVSIVLMVIGYRQADYIHVYSPPSWGIHLNNLLMLFAILLFGMGSSKGKMRAWFRHPMLIGFFTWAIAHLIVNGDLAALVLFGGLALWVPVTILLINRAERDWQRPEPGGIAGDIRLVVISAVLLGVIGFIHSWLGPWPFPG